MTWMPGTIALSSACLRITTLSGMPLSRASST